MNHENERELEEEPGRLYDSLRQKLPAWAAGFIGRSDSRFLFKSVLALGVDTILEIGTASGFSTAFLCHTLAIAHRAKRIGPDFKIISYDLSPTFYADPSQPTGSAAIELLPRELLSHVEFRNPATAYDAGRELPRDSIDFAFIDANHKHPWPTIDLLALLDCLRPSAVVVFHDINLPVLYPQFPDWGAKYAFDGLSPFHSGVSEGGDREPNTGSITIPNDKATLRGRLLEIAYAHPWQVVVPPAHLDRLGIRAAEAH